MLEIKTPLDYVPGRSIIPTDAFGISPSKLSKFITQPWNWYRTEVLGEVLFQYSTSTVLGTIIHYFAECYTKGIPVATCMDNITQYLYKLSLNQTEPTYLAYLQLETEERLEFLVDLSYPDEIDISYILANFRPMGRVLVSHLRLNGKPTKSEELISAEIMNNIWICGSYDAVQGDRLIDYKTTSSLTAPTSISFDYKLQLLAYAYALRQNNIHISTITIKFITHHQVDRLGANGKPLKDYPSTVTSVSESITEKDYEYIEGILRLVAETINLDKQHPEYRHILWKDMRLKQI